MAQRADDHEAKARLIAFEMDQYDWSSQSILAGARRIQREKLCDFIVAALRDQERQTLERMIAYLSKLAVPAAGPYADDAYAGQVHGHNLLIYTLRTTLAGWLNASPEPVVSPDPAERG